MWPSYITNPEFLPYRERAVHARVEAFARAGYLFIRALGSVQAATARVAGSAVTRVAEAVHLWRERRIARRELLLLDERMLRDIGLSRADVDAFIHGGPLPERDGESAAEIPTTDVALEAYANGNCADDWRRVA